MASAPAASGDVVITALVPSATFLSTAGCGSGVSQQTDFGTVLPGTSAVTSIDCAIQFGSSNDTAKLNVSQTDRAGVGMFQPSNGAMDPTFGAGGLVSTAVGPGTRTDDMRAMVRQSDGKLVVVGDCNMGGTGQDFCVVRYATNGTLDTTFDGDGRATTAIAPGGARDEAWAVDVQADGKIVVAGFCVMGGATLWDACVVRYMPNGALDTSFDVDGKVTTSTSPGAREDLAYALAIQPDGRIVTAGYCNMGGATGKDFCLARYLDDGSLDPTFDVDGLVTTNIGSGAIGDFALSMALQPDGRIVVAGHCDMGGLTRNDSCMVRYNADGSLDTTFDTDGKQSTAFAPGAGDDFHWGVVIQRDGKLLSSGHCNMGGAAGYDACVVRYNANGSLDTSFDGDGLAVLDLSSGRGDDLSFTSVLQDNGRLLIGGSCQSAVVGNFDACVVRLQTNGSLDPTFDGDGMMSFAMAASPRDDYVRALVLGTDGRVVAAGSCDMAGTTGFDACVARLDSAGTVPQYVGGVTDWSTPSTGHFGVCLKAVTSGTATWTPNATCAAADGPHWNAVPTAPQQIATANTNSTSAVATLRFGMRAASNQSPGSFVAPIAFDVIAP